MRVIFLRFLVLFTLAALVSSCAAVDAFIPTVTPVIPTSTLTSTPTFVWFPPTATPTIIQISTHLPTPDILDSVGEIILQDDFSRAALWDIAQGNLAGANINQNRLNLAAQDELYMMSIRHNTQLTDFYAEINASPSLCRNLDSYGILIRANAAAYYKISLYCNGTISAERISGKTRETLQKPIPSGDAPQGAGETRIGIWASGALTQVFLNERYQFEVNSAAYPTGSIGVFVNAAANTPVVVSFSDLVIHEIR